MSQQDIQPPPNSAGIERIKHTANNRLGAVFSSLFSFWTERQAEVNRNSIMGGVRKDAYSLIFFNHEQSTPIEYNFTSSPDELLIAALEFNTHGRANFSSALERAKKVMASHWNTKRFVSFPCQSLYYTIENAPTDTCRRTTVVIFLSSGEDNVKDKAMYDLCRDAVRQGFADLQP